MVDTHVPEHEVELGPSRTKKRKERKKTASALEAMATRLAGLPEGVFEKLELDAAVVSSVEMLRAMSPSDGLSRQRRFVAGQLRGLDLEAIDEAIGLLTGTSSAFQARLQTFERWRDRLVKGGDDVLAELLEAFPSADRQRFRQLIRAAKKELETEVTGRRYRELFKLLRELDDVPGEPDDSGPVDSTEPADSAEPAETSLYPDGAPSCIRSYGAYPQRRDRP